MTFRIAQISDTHLSDEKPFFVDNFVRIGEALRADRPDLVLNSGDISLDGAASESDLAAARALHDGLGLPLRFLPGNHDLGDSQDSPAHGEGTIDGERRARYLAHFGADWWSLDVPGWRLLGINAQLLASDLPEAAEQEAAIAEAAVTLGGRRLALFLHKPLFDRSVDESEITGRFVNPAPRRALLELAARNGAGADRLRPRPSVSQDTRGRRLPPCLGELDGLRHPRLPPAALRRQGSGLCRAPSRARRRAREPLRARVRRADAQHRRFSGSVRADLTLGWLSISVANSTNAGSHFQ